MSSSTAELLVRKSQSYSKNETRALSCADLRRISAQAMPERIPTEVSGLVGMPLFEAAQVSGEAPGLVPAPVVLCCGYIRRYALKEQGIFRKSGNTRRIDDYLEEMSSCFGEDICDHAKARLLFEADGEPKASPHDVAGVLTRYLRGLPEVLLTNHLASTFAQAAEDYEKNPEDPMRLYQLQVLMKLLPPCNRQTLRLIVDMCEDIAANSDINLMTVVNLGTCIGHTVAQPDTLRFILCHKDIVFSTDLRQVDVSQLEKAMGALSFSPTPKARSDAAFPKRKGSIFRPKGALSRRKSMSASVSTGSI